MDCMSKKWDFFKRQVQQYYRCWTWGESSRHLNWEQFSGRKNYSCKTPMPIRHCATLQDQTGYSKYCCPSSQATKVGQIFRREYSCRAALSVWNLTQRTAFTILLSCKQRICLTEQRRNIAQPGNWIDFSISNQNLKYNYVLLPTTYTDLNVN